MSERIPVVAGVIVREGRVLLTQRDPATQSVLGWHWCTPGGKVRPDEPDDEALARELFEELGLRYVSVGARLDTVNVEVGSKQFAVTYYSVAIPVDAKPKPIDTVGLGWFGPIELRALSLTPADVIFRCRLIALLGGSDVVGQPQPIANTEPAIWNLVIADVDRDDPSWIPWPRAARDLVIVDMRARHRLGLERYGVALQAHNGRDALRDYYEEQLDAVAYGRQCVEERLTNAEMFYKRALALSFETREVMERRKDLRAALDELTAASDDAGLYDGSAR